MMDRSSFLKTVTRLEVIIGSAIISLLIIACIFWRAYSRFEVSDPIPQIGYYIPIVEKAGVPQASSVDVGFFIRSFPVFDLVKNSFEIDVIVWFQFKPYKISADIIDDFIFERATIKSKTQIGTKMVGDEMFVKYAVRIAFQTNLIYNRFPFDDHFVSIVLTNKRVSPGDLRFVSKGALFGWAEDLFTYDWHIVNKDVRYGILTSQLEKEDVRKNIQSPAVVFTISLESGGRKILVLFIPFLLAVFLSFFALIIDSNSRPQIIGSITSLIILRFVVENLSPNIGYFTVIDKIYMFAFALVFLLFLLDLYLDYQQKKLLQKEDKKKGFNLFKDEDQIKTFKRCAFLFLELIIVVIIYVFVL